jgi:hypothetical protein
MRFWPFMLVLASLSVQAQEQEIQRALVQRDQQSAEFAAGVRGAPVLAPLHARQLQEVMLPLATELRPWQRNRMADERALVFAPPIVEKAVPLEPLPLPGGPRSGVDPVLPQGLPY